MLLKQSSLENNTCGELAKRTVAPPNQTHRNSDLERFHLRIPWQSRKQATRAASQLANVFTTHDI